MATIDSLAARLPADLEALLMDPTQQAAYEQQLVDRARGDIMEQGGNEARRVGEAYFGRGMGLSSLNAYAQGQVQGQIADALSKARLDANTNMMAAQRAALGQAANYVNAERGRQQQASQFNKQMKQQKSIANQNMLYGGLGGLAGGLAKGAGMMFAPEIKKGLQGLFSGTGAPGGQLPYGSNNYQQPEWMTKPVEVDPNAVSASVAAPDLSAIIDSSVPEDYSYSMPDFNYGDNPGLGISADDFNIDFSDANDLASLIDPSYDPYSDWSW